MARRRRTARRNLSRLYFVVQAISYVCHTCISHSLHTLSRVFNSDGKHVVQHRTLRLVSKVRIQLVVCKQRVAGIPLPSTWGQLQVALDDLRPTRVRWSQSAFIVTYLK